MHEQGRLLEAAYFLERMQAVLEEPDEFQYNLSAFLSAARSVAQYEIVVRHEENLMSAANRSSFVYVTVIRTTPEKLWEALTDAKFIRQYWFNAIVECGWKKGSPWRKARGDGSLTDSGEILEIDPPRRMVIRWQGEWKPEFKAEGPSRCTFALEPMDGAVKLTSTHEIERPESKFITAVSEGWPLVLSNLKSLLETGEVAMKTYSGH